MNRLHERAVPLLKRAYLDPRLTDGRHRAYLAGLATDYFGVSEAATEFVEHVARDDSMPAELKAMMVQSLAGYNMFSKQYVPLTDGEMLSRSDLLDSMAATRTNWPEVVRLSFGRVSAQLRHKARLKNNGE